MFRAIINFIEGLHSPAYTVTLVEMHGLDPGQPETESRVAALKNLTVCLLQEQGRWARSVHVAAHEGILRACATVRLGSAEAAFELMDVIERHTPSNIMCKVVPSDKHAVA